VVKVGQKKRFGVIDVGEVGEVGEVGGGGGAGGAGGTDSSAVGVPNGALPEGVE
jgi:hypothetical protein